MKNEILVPLDGSTRAEAILPHAVMVARTTASSITLLNAVEQPISAMATTVWMPVYSGPDLQQWEAEVESATGYLNQVAERLRDLGVAVNVRTARNAPAEAILAYATQRPDLRLIALATHGRTGLSRWLLGSVAETVVQGADQPVLLVRAPAEEASTVLAPVAPYTKILVALDGSARAEHVLADARSLAAATGASLLLLTVLPALDENPGVAEAVTIHGPESPQHEARQAAHTYLAGLAQPLEAAQVPVQTMIGYGHPAEAIVQIAAQERADVIALATHGRGGWQRLRWGSVTQEVVHQAETPVLVIRPDQHIGE